LLEIIDLMVLTLPTSGPSAWAHPAPIYWKVFCTPGPQFPPSQCWFLLDFHWVCSSLCCIAHSSLLLPPVSGLPPLLLPPSTGPRSHPPQPSFKHNTHIPALATVQKVLAFHSSYLWCNNPMTSYIALPIQPPLTMVTLDPNAEGFKPVTKQSQTDQKRWGTPNVCPAGESRVWNGNQDHFSNSLTVIMTHFDWHSRCSIFVEELLKYDPSLAFSAPEDNTDILYLQYYAFPMTKKDFVQYFYMHWVPKKLICQNMHLRKCTKLVWVQNGYVHVFPRLIQVQLCGCCIARSPERKQANISGLWHFHVVISGYAARHE